MTESVFVLDIGTTSLKAGLVSADGEVVFIFRKKYFAPLSLDVSKYWLSAFDLAFQKAKKFSKKRDIQIKAICISGNGPTIVDCRGKTLLWNGSNIPLELKEKARLELEKINLQLKEKNIHSLFLPRILLFKEVYKNSFDKSSYIFSGPEYLIYKLTGQALTILPEKRYQAAYWDSALLDSLGLAAEKFPAFVNTASLSGYFKGLPVFAGGPDFIVALIGTNTLSPGKICDRSGSSEGINLCVNKEIHRDGLRTLPSLIPDLWNCSVLIPNSSKLRENERLGKLKEGLKLLQELSKENDFEFPLKMKVTGGQTKNSFWMQKKATFLEMELEVCDCPDSELLGDACIAWMGLGKYQSLGQAAQVISKVERSYKAQTEKNLLKD
ncbi:MAG: hypothetical protein K5866_02500 [Treponema sp.]|nr:hypothetical protein [Treponema sp.]